MIFQMDQDWKYLAVYQTTNDLASNIPQNHLRSSMSMACCSELPKLQTKPFPSPQSLIYNLATTFSTMLLYHGPTSRKTRRATVPKTSSPSNLHLNYVQMFPSHPKQNLFCHQKWTWTATSNNETSKKLLINEWESRCGVRSRMTARLAGQVYNVTHTLNRVELSCFDWNKSAGFSFGTLSINNVHIFSSLKKILFSITWIINEAWNAFSSKKLGPSHQNLVYRNFSNLFKRVKISEGLCSVLQYCQSLKLLFLQISCTLFSTKVLNSFLREEIHATVTWESVQIIFEKP